MVKQSNPTVYLMPLDHNCRERTGWANIFTGTAANAGLLIDGGYPGRLFIVFVQGNHLDGSGRTVAFTVTTLHAVGHGHTVLLDKDGMTYLDGRFLVTVYQMESPSRTNLRATCTFRAAEASFV